MSRAFGRLLLQRLRHRMTSAAVLTKGSVPTQVRSAQIAASMCQSLQPRPVSPPAIACSIHVLSGRLGCANC